MAAGNVNVPAMRWATDRLDVVVPGGWPEALVVLDCNFWSDPIACGGLQRPSIRQFAETWGWSRSATERRLRGAGLLGHLRDTSSQERDKASHERDRRAALLAEYQDGLGQVEPPAGQVEPPAGQSEPPVDLLSYARARVVSVSSSDSASDSNKETSPPAPGLPVAELVDALEATRDEVIAEVKRRTWPATSLLLSPPVEPQPKQPHPDREAFDRCASRWKQTHPGGVPLDPSRGQGKLIAQRIKQYGPEAVLKVITWACGSDHSKAVFLRERGYGLNTLMRPEKFEGYALDADSRQPDPVADWGRMPDGYEGPRPKRTPEEERAAQDAALERLRERGFFREEA